MRVPDDGFEQVPCVATVVTGLVRVKFTQRIVNQLMLLVEITGVRGKQQTVAKKGPYCFSCADEAVQFDWTEIVLKNREHLKHTVDVAVPTTGVAQALNSAGVTGY